MKTRLNLIVALTAVALIGGCGEDGSPGSNGGNGADGTTGADGADGADGANGADGADGAIGADGADGSNGSDGGLGPIGMTGAQGDAGLNAPLDSIIIPGASAYPEGIAIAANGDLYIGSLVAGRVHRVAADSYEPTEFITAGLQNPVGMLIVGANLWVCNISFTTGFDAAAELVGFDLATATEVGRHVFPGAGATVCNDLTADGSGNLYATDSFSNHIVEVTAADAETNSAATIWSADALFAANYVEGFGLNGIVHNGTDMMYVVSYATGELFSVAVENNGAAGTVSVMATQDSTPAARLLNLPDGLKLWDADTLMVVEQGANWIAGIDLTSGTITPVAGGLDAPSTMVFDDAGDAWVVNSQLDDFLGGTAPTLPFDVAFVPLGG